MYRFQDDYSEGCHPTILKALQESNFEQEEGYGNDKHSLYAKELIRKEIKLNNIDIHFVTGGTQANLLLISSVLRPYEAVIAPTTGHINVHEAGAIEATGHKVCSVWSKDGKLTPELVQQVLDQHEEPPHMVKPRMVYISNTTEVGTVYTKAELKCLYKFCQQHNLFLFLDGARLGVALTSNSSDMDLHDIASHTDAFYIGGTKNGALLGEAIVLKNHPDKRFFTYNIKQKGALMAKGRLLGLQFQALFQNRLFFDLATHANKMALLLAKGIEGAGHKFLLPPCSNQIFPILPKTLVKKLQEKYSFYIWQEIDSETTSIRLVCSWATQEEEVLNFITNCVI